MKAHRLAEVIEKALKKYGIDMQMNIAIEEMAELTKELIKSKRGKKNTKEIKQELADVYIMVCQLVSYYGDIGPELNYKIERLNKMIEEDDSHE